MNQKLASILLGTLALVAQASASEAADKAVADLASRLKMDKAKISVVIEKPTTWLDGSLGLRQPDRVYTKAIENGSVLILEALHTKYLYTAGNSGIRFGGPVNLWKNSLLYLAKHENEPNLNDDLMACSLLGTNPRLVLEKVSDYQLVNGKDILALRRTSRSGFELLLLRAGQTKPEKIDAGFNYGPFAGDGNLFVVYKRSSIISDWTIEYGKFGEKERKTAPALPEGKPELFVVLDGLIFAKTAKDWYSLDSADANPKWDRDRLPLNITQYRESPVLLNRRESLFVEAEGKDTVVSTTLFGDGRVEVARIPNLKLQAFDYLLGRYVVVMGQRDEKTAVFVVDLHSKAVFDSLVGDYRAPRVWAVPAEPSPELKDVL